MVYLKGGLMKIDLDALSESQLRELNRAIVKRLEIFSFTRRKVQLMAFQIGDRVEFDNGREIISGTVVRVNQKTASIETDDGPDYRVAPSLLRKIVNERPAQEAQGNLFQLKSKSV